MDIRGNKKIIRAWTFYDWANSIYPLVITSAVFPIYYDNVVKADLGGKIELFGRTYIHTELYGYVVALSFIVVCFTAPILSGIADYSGKKKSFMQLFCYLGALASASLYFFSTQHIVLSLLSVFFASVGFWGSLVFYNAYLPEIAAPEDQDKVSARGFSMGYIGSSILLIICLVLILKYDMFGFADSGSATRFSFVLASVWWIGFAQIPFRVLPNNVYGHKPEGNVLTKGFRELQSVWKDVSGNFRLKIFLGSFFVYSMGVQTVMLMAVSFAKEEIYIDLNHDGLRQPGEPGMPDSDLIISILIIQFVGVLGSVFFSRLSGWIGNVKALGVSIFIWMGVCIGTYLWVYGPVSFYIAASAVGLVMGGIQSLSRSTYSKFLPETEDHASYFSFYDVTEKISLVVGIFTFAYINGLKGGMRPSILALISFFVIGFIILLFIPKSKTAPGK
jgi:UMF1 family MFS transporter